MKTDEANIDVDFSEMAFCEAVGQLEVSPDQAVIWVPARMIATAYLVSEKFKCKVIAIPNVLVKSPFCWGVSDDVGGFYWGEGPK